MKNKTTENITIFKQVIEVMEKNHTLWGHVPKLRQAYDKFLENNKKIEDAVIISLEDITSLEMKKKETAELLRKKCKPFLQVISIWAKDSEKKNIAGKLSSFKKLIKSSNPAVILKISEFIQKLSAEALSKEAVKKPEKNADKKVAALSEFGITKEMLIELHETSTALEQIVLVLRKKKTDIAKAKNVIEKLTSQNKKLLKSRISKFMVLFINSQPLFYEKFETALKIVHLSNNVEKKKTIIKTNGEVVKKLRTIKKVAE